MDDKAGLQLAEGVAQRVAQGRLAQPAAEALLHAELSADCPNCQRTYQEALTSLFGPRPGAPRLFLLPPQAEPPPKPRDRRDRPDARERQRRALAALVHLKSQRTWPQREDLVGHQWFRYRGTELGQLLLAEAKDALPGDPEESGQWAALAVQTLSGSRERQYPDREERAVQALRARFFVANAWRCHGDLQAAQAELELTLQAAADVELRDLAFWAEAKSAWAALLRAQRQFAAATREARASATLYRAASLPLEESLARWQWATIREGAGDYATALRVIRAAQEQAAASPAERLFLDLRHAEAIYLARLGRFAEADAIRVSLRPLYDQHPDKDMLRFWLRALVKAGLGDHEAAAASFQFTRDGFVIRKNPFDAALVTLDWTLYLLDQNRPADVVPLAVSMGQTFEALGVARETIASWALFREAAERLELERTEAAAWVEVLDFERVGGRGRN